MVLRVTAADKGGPPRASIYRSAHFPPLRTGPHVGRICPFQEGCLQPPGPQTPSPTPSTSDLSSLKADSPPAGPLSRDTVVTWEQLWPSPEWALTPFSLGPEGHAHRPQRPVGVPNMC